MEQTNTRHDGYYQLCWTDESNVFHEERLHNETQAIRRRRELKNLGFVVQSKRIEIETTEIVKTMFRSF